MTHKQDTEARPSMSRRGFLRSGGAVALTPAATPLLFAGCGGDGDAGSPRFQCNK